MSTAEYKNKVFTLLNNIEETQKVNIKQAAKIIKDTIENEGVLHVFSTGHSHMIIEEMFYRTGGLVPVNPVFETSLMLHEGAFKSSRLERLPGYAEIIIESNDLRENEPIIIISNSGINPVPIDMAMKLRQRGLKVIAITSRDISAKNESRHVSGQKLYDFADLVIDNCIVDNDAAVLLKGMNQKVGSLSSLAGIYIANSLVVEIAHLFREDKITPPLFKSANLPGGDEHNKKLINRYKNRIKELR